VTRGGELGGEPALTALLARPEVRTVLAALDDGGEETRLVGGAIRNALLGEAVHEIDFCTTATPDVTTRRARAAGLRVVPTGIEHGTVTVLVADDAFEVTTLREDVETDGRHALVRFGRSFRADALRRDFTVNALSLSADGRLHDEVGGVADVQARRVRFIGDPSTRIREDYLRILRFFRFHAQVGEGPLDAAGLAAAIRERAGLSILSRERVRAELLKLLGTRRAVPTIAAMSESGFLALILGGVGEMGRLNRVAVCDAGAPDPVRRLAALSVQVSEDAERLGERLRLSSAEEARLRAYALALTALRTRPSLDASALRVAAAVHGREAVVDGLAVLAGEPRPRLAPDAAALFERYVAGIEDAPVFPLRGADLLSLGLPPGPEIGRLLDEARRQWLAEGCPEGSEARRILLQRMAPGAA
jgi:poly(A) polymerase